MEHDQWNFPSYFSIMLCAFTDQFLLFGKLCQHKLLDTCLTSNKHELCLYTVMVRAPCTRSKDGSCAWSPNLTVNMHASLKVFKIIYQQ